MLPRIYLLSSKNALWLEVSCHLSVNLSLVDLSVKFGSLPTKAAVKHLIRQGGLYMNNQRVESEGKIIEATNIIDDKMLLLSAGKKNKLVVRIASFMCMDFMTFVV